MSVCNYTSNDIFVCGSVFCHFDISHQYSNKTWSINEYNESFIGYDIKNHIKYVKILGDLYIYDGGIRATGKATSFCYVEDILSKEGVTHKGDLIIQGDFFIKGIYAKDGIYSDYDIPLSVIRRIKLNQIF